jgi:nucleoside-triphosphatase THEP1
MRRRKAILLTGAPGVGKSTLLHSLFTNIVSREPTAIPLIEVRGFVTREIRNPTTQQREGFEVEVLSSVGTSGSNRFVFAHVDQSQLPSSSSSSLAKFRQVSRYWVDVKAFEDLLVKPHLDPKTFLHVSSSQGPQGATHDNARATGTDAHQQTKVVYIIDEIGPMACSSTLFRKLVTQLLDFNSNLHLSVTGRAEKWETMVVASIALKSQDKFINGIKARQDVELWQVSKRNRNELQQQLLDHVLSGGGVAK